ncbi:MAG: hypothetical protein WA063_02635 [Minisyncoccia bacterium]
MKNKYSLLKKYFGFRKFNDGPMLVADLKRKSYTEILVTPRDSKAFDEEREYFFIPPQKSENPIKDNPFYRIYGVDMLQIKKIPMFKEEIKVIESFFPADAASQEESLFIAIINDLQESPAENIIFFELSRKNNLCFLRVNNKKIRMRLFGLLKRRCRSEFAIENNDENKTITISAPKEEERYYNFYNTIIEVAISVLSKPKRQKPFIFLFE